MKCCKSKYTNQIGLYRKYFLAAIQKFQIYTHRNLTFHKENSKDGGRCQAHTLY